MYMEKERLFRVCTQKTSTFKNIIEYLSQQISEEYQFIINKNFILIRFITQCRKNFFSLKLSSDKFDTFEISQKMKIRIDLKLLSNYLSIVDNDLPIELYMLKDNEKFLYIKNGDESNSTKLKIQIDNDCMYIPRLNACYDGKIKMSLDNFNDMCNTYLKVSNHLTIIQNKNCVTFKVVNENNKISKKYYVNRDSDIDKEFIKLDLNNLLKITKSLDTSSDLNLYIKSGFLTTLHTTIDDFGELYIYVAPAE